MKLLYFLTLASLALALAITVPALLPSLDAPSPRVAHAQTVETQPHSLCGNLFDDSGSLCGPRQSAPEEELTRCDAPALLGIVHGESADRALFAGLGVVKQGGTFENGYALLEVHSDRTVLGRGASRCEIRLFQPSEERAPEESVEHGFRLRDGRMQIPRAVLAFIGPQSLSRLRAVPTRRGIRMGGITPESLAARLGLRSGDLIMQVDGRPLTPDSAVELASGLDRLEHISALVRRGNEEFTLRADIID